MKRNNRKIGFGQRETNLYRYYLGEGQRGGCFPGKFLSCPLSLSLSVS